MGQKYETHELPALAAALDGYIPDPDAYTAEVEDRGYGTAYVTEGFKTGNSTRRGPFPIKGPLPSPEGEHGIPRD